MTATHQNVRDKYSPLRELIISALQRYGDFSASQLGPSVNSMLMEFANEIIDDHNIHPYAKSQLTHYISIDEAREIPDNIVITGVLFKFSEQQGSDSAPRKEQRYYAVLNDLMYKEFYGGSQPIIMKTVER